MCIRDRYSPGCPRTHFVDQAGPKLRNLPASASQVLGLKACTSTTWLKGQHLIGTELQVQRFSPLSSRWEHGSTQAGIVQAKLRVLYLHLKSANKILTSRQLGWGSQNPHPQWQTYSNKATPPISVTPWLKHIQTIIVVKINILMSSLKLNSNINTHTKKMLNREEQCWDGPYCNQEEWIFFSGCLR